MSHKVICLGREFGSGGHEIALRAAGELGIRVYEKDLFTLACKYGEVSEKTLLAADEAPTNPWLFRTVHEGNYHVTRGLPTSEVLFALQSHEIRRIAGREDCIFVGRCADIVLADRDVRMLRVFVHAPEEQRIARKMEQEHLSHEKAARLVRKMDRQRRRYYESYAHRPWGDAAGCDLFLDTGALSLDQAAQAICDRYRAL